MPSPSDPEIRQHWGLVLGQRLAERHVGAPRKEVPPPPKATLAERLLWDRDWRRLEDAYESLHPLEQQVLDRRFGLAPAQPERHLHGEIAAQLGWPEAAVRQILSRAIAKLDSLL